MEPQQNNRNFKELVSILKRRYKLLLYVAVPIALVGVLISLLVPPVYRSEAVILIEQQEIPTDMVRSTVSSFADQRLQVIAQRVMTSANLNEIINQFDLYPDLLRSEPREVVLEKMRDDISLEMISAEVVDPRSGRPTQATIAFSLAYESLVPRLAQRVTNELVTLYLNENIKTRSESAAETTSFLSGEVERQAEEVARYEELLAKFKNENVENRPEMEGIIREAISRNELQLGEVNRYISEARQNLAYLDGELAQLEPVLPERVYGQFSSIERMKIIESELAAAEASYGDTHPDVVRLRRQAEAVRAEVDPAAARKIYEDQVETARQEYLRLSKQYGGQHPDVEKARSKLATLEDRLESVSAGAKGEPNNPAYITLKARIESAKVQIRAGEERRAAIEEKIDQLTGSLMRIPDAELEYRALTRDYESALLKFRELKAKQMEARLSQNLETERKGEKFNLIEPPLLPEKAAKPNRLSLVLLALLLAAGAGLTTVTIAEGLDDKIRGSRGVTQMLSAPPLAVIPEIDYGAAPITSSKNTVLAVLGVGVLIFIIALVHFRVMPLDVAFFVALRKFGL